VFQASLLCLIKTSDSSQIHIESVVWSLKRNRYIHVYDWRNL